MAETLFLAAVAIGLALLLHQRQRRLDALTAELAAERAKPAPPAPYPSVLVVRIEEVFDLRLEDGNVYRASRYNFRLTAQTQVKVFVHMHPEKDRVIEPGETWEMTFSPTLLHGTPPLPTPPPRKPRDPDGVEATVIPFPKDR